MATTTAPQRQAILAPSVAAVSASPAAGDLAVRAFSSGLAAGAAECLTLPTDVAKVRLQVQRIGPEGPQYKGLFDCASKIVAQEGPGSLWKGLAPALVRQVNYTATALVVYEPIRDTVVGEGNTPSYFQRLFAGGSAGSFGIAVWNPAEVVKTQIQTERTKTLKMIPVAKAVFKTEGILGFWAGVGPNVARSFLVNAAELGTYDEAKHQLKPYLGDTVFTHMGASGVAGFVSACTSTPADVVKTRLMDGAGRAEKQYSGVINAFTTILKEEGATALYKGFVPIVTRKVIWCGLFFTMYEQIKASLK